MTKFNLYLPKEVGVKSYRIRSGTWRALVESA